METPPPQQPPQDPTPQPTPRPAPQPDAAGYPRPPVGPTIRFDVIGEAFKMVFADIGTWAVAALCVFVVVAVIMGALYIVLFAALMHGGGIVALFGYFVGIFVAIAVGNLMMANMFRMAIMALSGTKPAVGEMFKFGANSTNVIVTSLIVGIASAVGTMICYIPGLIVGGLFMFAMPLVVDRNMAPMDAINESINTLKKDWLMAALFYFVIGFCAGIGEIACIIGIVVTLPVYPLAISMLYRDYLGFANPAPEPSA